MQCNATAPRHCNARAAPLASVSAVWHDEWQMDWNIIIGLIIAGFVLLGLETVLPGMVAGLLGCFCLVLGVGLSFAGGPVAGGATFMAVFALLMVVMYAYFTYFPKSAVGRSVMLNEVNEGASAPAAPSTLVGRQGVMASPAYPTGMASLDGRRVEVVAESGFLESGDAVEVVSVSGTRVVVRPASAANRAL
ncbi:hypothetical protein DB346_01865 [Verrucomicrobia bacterium LW23]|nr:hypothetical protein DB346_01865 [Verrucomicrobia bacterium LW23]